MLDPLQRWRQHRAHGPGIDRSIGVASDRAIDGAMVEAGAAADAAKHVLEDAAQHLAPSVVEQHDMVGARSVRVVVAARPRREARVGRHVLARRRAGEQPEDRRGVLERRHYLLDRSDDDVRARQRRGEVAVAFIGEDHRAARLGDQQVGPSNADVGGDEFLSQNGARLCHQVGDGLELSCRGQRAVRAAKIGLDRLFVEVDDGRNDVARGLAPDLHDIFAEVGLDHLDAGCFQMGIQSDLLRDHGLALGDALGFLGAAKREQGIARLRRRACVMHFPAALVHLLLIGLEIEVEITECVVLDRPRLGAKLIELGQFLDRRLALQDEAALDVLKRTLELRVGERLARIAGEAAAGRCHRAPVSGP